VLVLIRTF